MKFIDKIRILEQHPKFQESRRKLKAMAYIASRNPSMSLTLSQNGVMINQHDNVHHLLRVDGWVLRLDDPKKQYWDETLSMIPLSEHKLQEI